MVPFLFGFDKNSTRHMWNNFLTLNEKHKGRDIKPGLVTVIGKITDSKEENYNMIMFLIILLLTFTAMNQQFIVFYYL